MTQKQIKKARVGEGKEERDKGRRYERDHKKLSLKCADV